CLALLKAWYPDQTNDRITDLLINSADDIDELNSSYAGKLGSGRVNVYNAIARSIFPSLSIVEFFTEVVDENGDDEINPGENFKLSFIVENADGWQDADNVTINLSSGSPSVSMIDSSAVIGIIAAGEADYNTDDELTAKISSDANYEPVKILVSITANQSADHPYNYKDSIEVAVSLNQPGFPVTGGAVDVPVTVDNIAGDALPEIITIDADNKLNVYDNNGGMVEGFPYNIGSYVSMCPALADVDNDGRNDIIFASRSGELYIIDHSGDSLLYKDIGEQIFGNISIANMDDDDDLEIVFGTMLRNLHVLNPDGTELPGFPKNCGVPIEHGISLADLDSDGIPEMVAGLFNSTLVILKADGDTLNNFPVTLSSRIKATPLVVKTESSFKIIAATLDQNLNIINSSGAIENQYKYEASIAGPPALCDLQDDGNIEIFFGTEDGLLHGVNIAGESLENFPVQLNGAIRTSPVFAEFDDDNIMDIVITTASGYVYIIDSNGQLYPGFPAILDDYLNGSPAVSDIDRDGDLEIISGGGKGLYVFDIKGQKGNRNFWQTFLGNNRRTGFYGDGITNIENSKSPGVIENFILYQNFPNPFNPVTTINFKVPDNVENEILKLDIFNILGQRIVSLFSGRPAAGLNTITWDGKDMNGKRVPSGIYVYSLYNDKIHLTRKLLFIK
ncbi:MAG: FlgD immunoglobulin-like domain containing protein, partial [Calditrichaceae bacterium]